MKKSQRKLLLILLLLTLLSYGFLAGSYYGSGYMAILPAVAVAGGLALGGSLLSGLFGSKSVSSQNKTNLQIARETNQANREIANLTSLRNLQNQREAQLWERENMDIQNQWNIDQWKRENIYNSPASQVARLMAAGINPNMHLVNSGSAGQLQSASPGSVAPASAVPAQMQAAKVEAVPTFGQSLGSALEKGALEYFDLESRMIDNQMKRTAQQYQEDQIVASLEDLRAQKTKMLADAGLSNRQSDKVRSEIRDLDERLDYFKKIRPWMEQHSESQVEQDRQIIETYKQDRQMQYERNMREWHELQLKEIATQSGVNLNNATISKLSAEAVNLRLMADGISYDNQTKYSMSENARMDLVKRSREFALEVENYVRDLRKAYLLSQPQYEAALAELNKIKAQNSYDEWFKYGYENGVKNTDASGYMARGVNYIFSQIGQALGGGTGVSALFRR